jgi:hypothetical protein
VKWQRPGREAAGFRDFARQVLARPESARADSGLAQGLESALADSALAHD